MNDGACVAGHVMEASTQLGLEHFDTQPWSEVYFDTIWLQVAGGRGIESVKIVVQLVWQSSMPRHTKYLLFVFQKCLEVLHSFLFFVSHCELYFCLTW